MARPYWSGQIQISLVSFGVKFFVATEAKNEIRFHQISRKTGERVKYQKVSASAAEQQAETGADTKAADRVEKDEIVKGYEFRKGQYVMIEPEEIAQLRVPSKHTVAIEQFVGLRKSKKAALGKIAFGGREHVLALTADEDDEMRGMMAYTMRYAQELRDPKEYFNDIKKVTVAEDSLDLAMELIKRKTAKFDASKFVDGYEVALKELVDAKVNNQPVPQDEPVAAPRGKVVNLMDALRKSVGSVGADGETKSAPVTTPAAAKKRSAKAAAAEEKQGITLVHAAPAKAGKGTKAASKKKSA